MAESRVQTDDRIVWDVLKTGLDSVEGIYAFHASQEDLWVGLGAWDKEVYERSSNTRMYETFIAAEETRKMLRDIGHDDIQVPSVAIDVWLVETTEDAIDDASQQN